jgi:hypothetical protein
MKDMKIAGRGMKNPKSNGNDNSMCWMLGGEIFPPRCPSMPLSLLLTFLPVPPVPHVRRSPLDGRRCQPFAGGRAAMPAEDHYLTSRARGATTDRRAAPLQAPPILPASA